MKLRVLVKADCRPHLEIYDEIARGLSDAGCGCVMRAVECDNYYRNGTAAEWKQRGIATYEMPRAGASRGVHQEAGSDAGIWKNFPIVSRAFDSALAEFRPHIFLLPYDVGLFEAGFLRRCAQRYIPSLIVQEGMILRENGSDRDFDRYFDRERRSSIHDWRTLPATLRASAGLLARRFRGEEARPTPGPFGFNGASQVAAIGPLFERLLVMRGLPPETVTATGLPRFDRLWRVAMANGRSPSRAALPMRDRIRVLFMQDVGFYYGADLAAVQRDLRAAHEMAVRLRDTADVVVRLRPEERESDYDGWWPELLPLLSRASGQDDLYEALLGGDVVIAVDGSTTAVEAMALGLPVIHYETLGEDSFGLAANAAALRARDAAEMTEAVRRIAADEELARRLAEGRARFLAERVLVDGNAGRRVAELMIRMTRDLND